MLKQSIFIYTLKHFFKVKISPGKDRRDVIVMQTWTHTNRLKLSGWQFGNMRQDVIKIFVSFNQLFPLLGLFLKGLTKRQAEFYSRFFITALSLSRKKKKSLNV